MTMRWWAAAVWAVVAAVSATSSAELRVLVPVPAGGAPNQLPYQMPDGRGGQWMVMHQGRLSYQGHPGTFAQAAVMQINGRPVDGGDNTAIADGDTGLLTLATARAGDVEVVRRLQILPDGDLLVADELTARSADLEAVVKLTHAMNFGVMASSKVPADPKAPEASIGYVAMTPQRQAALHLAGLPRAKVLAQIDARPRDNNFETSWKLSLRRGRPVVLVHAYGQRASIDAATAAIRQYTSERLLAGLPEPVRKGVANLPTAAGTLGDIDLLRGGTLDVIELHGGDRLTGTIQESSYTISGLFGDLTLPPEQVLGILSVGRQNPRQLLVTRDGQVLGGVLGRPTIALQLAGGQRLEVPLASVARVGYRTPDAEVDAPTTQTPYVSLRGGDRMAIEPPAAPIPVVTRFGRIDVAPEMIHTLALGGAIADGRQLTLVNGTAIFAMPAEPELTLTIRQSGSVVRLPMSEVMGLQLREGDTPQPSGAVLQTTDGDTLVGGLDGVLEVETEFDVIRLDGTEVRSIARGEKPGTLKVVVWDETAITGRPAGLSVRMLALPGLAVSVPVGLVEAYVQPNPMASASMVEKIKGLVERLSDEDWRVRDRAQSELVSMGKPVVPILKSMQPGVPAEASQRIGAILNELESDGSGDDAGKASETPAAPFGIDMVR